MSKRIFVSLGSALLLGLGGCSSYPLAPTELTVKLSSSEAGSLYVYKNSSGFENCYPKMNSQYGYSIWGGHCILEPKDVPEKVVIEYARWLKSGEGTRKYKGSSEYDSDSGEFVYRNPKGVKLSREQWLKEGWQREVNAIAKLPPSAWRTFTIYPKQLLKKYQGVTPKTGSAITSGFAKDLVYILSMQPDSTIKTSESYGYKYTGEGWRN